ncbi:hypothetical protein TREPR_2760 [Treponema primitia ZAS-2]|uniref:Guanylate cyclase domain-containing protein n=1 Tax=Treponema primitia (strain ATCC BAA-887 / DSM 12427 / ZAS-2) TaxID=545694 RepID=F5YQH7_TREPZ|nr:hypothetical protein [Treponema primitia]AEF86526.1 hypothetical protein TREPR_2760 [Treponema primitia ZAS-2]
MKDLTEYNDDTSEYELFSFLCDRIISGEIHTFSALKEFAQPVLRNKRTHPVISRAFTVIRRLYWGFFSGMTMATHKKLWPELVISDKEFPEAGDLKRTLSISDLYISMMDIHGYTKLCQDSRKNLSMLHTLDRTINNEIRNISTQCQSVSQRERGDEIVLISASATDALTATIAIIDYFGKTSVLKDPEISTVRTGDAAILPVLKITAGITGGNTTSPLIITESGNLSGFLLNSGARLQNRANELSPQESRVMVTKQVYLSYMKENNVAKTSLFKNDVVYFFDTGIIEFKGVQMPTCEAVFKPEERYKEGFSDEMNRLFSSTKDSLWEQRVYQDLMDLLTKAATVMPRFHINLKYPVSGLGNITNDAVIELCRQGLKAYTQDEDYSTAVQTLRHFQVLLEQIPNFDRLILDYLRGITDKYDTLLKSYEATIDMEIENNAQSIFSGNHLKTYQASKNGAAIYEKLRAIGRKSPALTRKKPSGST